jgi:dihydrofolate reductase
MSDMGRKIIAALQVSVDGFIEGPNGEMDWVMTEDEEAWKYMFEMLSHIDTFILGRKMYPVYEQYWLAVLADPDGILPLSVEPHRKMKSNMRDWLIAGTISFYLIHWIEPSGRRRGLFEMWMTSKK